MLIPRWVEEGGGHMGGRQGGQIGQNQGVGLVSLITPKRIEPITWEWSHFENILKENAMNFQNEG